LGHVLKNAGQAEIYSIFLQFLATFSIAKKDSVVFIKAGRAPPKSEQMDSLCYAGSIG